MLCYTPSACATSSEISKRSFALHLSNFGCIYCCVYILQGSGYGGDGDRFVIFSSIVDRLSR